MILNNKDIYYNKDKFDNGDINLCIVTGLSGGGKTTMTLDIERDENYEVVHLDDLCCIKDHFTMEDLKDYGGLIYSYFKTIGKEFYLSAKELEEFAKDPDYQYENKLFPEFVSYAEQYAKAHKNKKIVLEGVWFYVDNWFKPEQFNKYAVCIKGTSMVLSRWRAAKRDSEDAKSRLNRIRAFIKDIFNIKRWYYYAKDEEAIIKWRDFYNKSVVY